MKSYTRYRPYALGWPMFFWGVSLGSSAMLLLAEGLAPGTIRIMTLHIAILYWKLHIQVLSVLSMASWVPDYLARLIQGWFN